MARCFVFSITLIFKLQRIAINISYYFKYISKSKNIFSGAIVFVQQNVAFWKIIVYTVFCCIIPYDYILFCRHMRW